MKSRAHYAAPLLACLACVGDYGVARPDAGVLDASADLPDLPRDAWSDGPSAHDSAREADAAADSACTPACAGKVCGADDGCGGVCDGTCVSGQRCDQGRCLCDATACPTGCCRANRCESGNALDACGTGGVSCQDCGSGHLCVARRCVVQHTVCGTRPAASCSLLCGDKGYVCAPGLDGKPHVVGTAYDAETCGSNRIDDVEDCDRLIAMSPRMRMACSCVDP
jgi:hypothetical protein